jgi:hypothetical protein
LFTLVNSEDTLALQQRMQLLSQLWDEVTDQISMRSKQIESHLEQWSDFGDRCNGLMAAMENSMTALGVTTEMPIEDLIVMMKSVSSESLLILCLDKRHFRTQVNCRCAIW